LFAYECSSFSEKGLHFGGKNVKRLGHAPLLLLPIMIWPILSWTYSHKPVFNGLEALNTFEFLQLTTLKLQVGDPTRNPVFVQGPPLHKAFTSMCVRRYSGPCDSPTMEIHRLIQRQTSTVSYYKKKLPDAYLQCSVAQYNTKLAVSIQFWMAYM
jgi:hypothetical protein